MNSGPVLVVGGTGMLGGQVVDALLVNGKHVRALVRPGSDATRLEAAGVDVARKGDTADTDTIGNRNLADAAARAGVRRFVLTSILTCDQTPQVPHFWHKKLAEDRLEELGVPFVALRPGAFLDQITRFGGDPFAKKRLTWVGSARIPLTFVLTADLAGYLAAAVDTPGVDGQRIDIGWDRPVGMQEIAEISGRILGQRIKVRSIPAGLIRGIGTVLGPVAPTVKDLAAMVDWFQTGRYVADTARQEQVFGTVPTAQGAVARLITSLGHTVPD